MGGRATVPELIVEDGTLVVRAGDRETGGRRGSYMEEQIRTVLAEHGRLAVGVTELADDTDLYQAGLSSHASINVMLALEDAFDVEFPERMLQKRTFESIAAIREAINELADADA